MVENRTGRDPPCQARGKSGHGQNRSIHQSMWLVLGIHSKRYHRVSGTCFRACPSVSTPAAWMSICDFCIFIFKRTCTIHCQASFICIKSKRYVCQLMCTMCMWEVILCFDMFAHRMLPLLTSIHIRGAVAEIGDVGSRLFLFFGPRISQTSNRISPASKVHECKTSHCWISSNKAASKAMAFRRDECET